ncbi:MAG TPA: GHMP kinase [Phycisphaerales bacterium]|nr:GHMP kinase [Phycisphaerales bacterium]
MIIRTKAYPRVGLIGNPSDGYFGRTIGFAFTNFCAEVILYESPELEILPSQKDQSVFGSVAALVRDVELHGYYGGIRLLKATVKRFCDYCRDNQIELHDKNFTLRYRTDIPHGVGLAGSSAIITACLRALMTFYGVAIPKPMQAALVLSAEKDELRISAGLQDRVIQVYEGLVYMDFDKVLMEKQGHGLYEPMDPGLLPRLYVAYADDFSEPTEVFHNDVRARFELGDSKVHAAMRFWANLTRRARRCIEKRQTEALGKLLNANFDRRRRIYRLNPHHVQMVETARRIGASAKFTGSGGAIVGIYENEKMFRALRQELARIGAKTIKPRVARPDQRGPS